MKLFIINPGATSTKVAVFENETEIYSEKIAHSQEELSGFSSILEQLPMREKLVRGALERAGLTPHDLAAVCSRGGLLRHIESGTYEITDAVIQDVYHPPYGEHASSLGSVIARSIADEAGIPAYIVDPPSVDELAPIARISGFKGMERESFFHALNQKAIARKVAEKLGKTYEDINLIITHMGGGVSTAAHQKGRAIDVFNVRDEGGFSLDRGGSLPVSALVNYCFSGPTRQEIKHTLSFESGVCSYLGTHDFRDVEDRMLAGDEEAKCIFRAMAYQLAKDIGSMAAVLHFDVDVIVLTGGIAHSRLFCDEISQYVEKIAPILRFPGELEMEALALGALRALNGGPVKVYPGK
jgi:butyrate kinase